MGWLLANIVCLRGNPKKKNEGIDVRPTLHQLRLFEAVARRLSFTRAAEELFLTQPTVSMQIKQLAEDVGLPLFEQIGKKISLTDAGRELHETTREMFDALSRFEMRVADLRGMKQGELRIATTTTATYFLPDAVGVFLTQYPEVDVRLEIATREKLIERLDANQDDLYVMALPPEDGAIERAKILDGGLVVVAPKAHRLAQQHVVTLEQIAGERFIAREPGSDTGIRVSQLMAERSLQLDVRMSFDSDVAILHAVAASLGIAIVSQLALSESSMDSRLAVLPVEGFPLREQWFVAYPSGKRLSVLAKSFFDFLVERRTARGG
jgi:LysR family transcriptional regulator, low CO2-responsive transcriptional regulator